MNLEAINPRTSMLANPYLVRNNLSILETKTASSTQSSQSTQSEYAAYAEQASQNAQQAQTAQLTQSARPTQSAKPNYNQCFQKMVLKCAFPAGFANGLYHTIVGLWICVSGFIGVTFATSTSQETTQINLPILIAGIIAATAISYWYGKRLQLKAIFPRGASIPSEKGHAPVICWILPLIIFAGAPIYATSINASNATPLIIGAIFAVLALVSYAASNKISLLAVSFACMLLPSLLCYFNICMSDTVLDTVLTTIPYEGIIFVACGLILMNSSMSSRVKSYDRKAISSFLNSENSLKKFAALCYLCKKLDPLMLPDLLKFSQSDDYMIAFTAQIALGNIWGPKPEKIDALPSELAQKLPEDYIKNLEGQLELQNQEARSKWIAHQTYVEKELEKIASGNCQSDNEQVSCTQEYGEGDQNANSNEQTSNQCNNSTQNIEPVEALYALALGHNVHYDIGRLVAIEMLGSLRTPRAYATLMGLLQHQNKYIAQAAIAGFYGADSSSVLYLEKFFVAKRSWLRNRAIAATRNMLYYLVAFDPQDADVAYSLLQDDIDALLNTDDVITFASTLTLLPAQDDQDIRILEGYLASPRPIVKIQAMRTLAYLAPTKALSHVVSALENQHAAVRYAALKCLDILQSPKKVQLYRQMTNDKNNKISSLARQRLAMLESFQNYRQIFYMKQ